MDVIIQIVGIVVAAVVSLEVCRMTINSNKETMQLQQLLLLSNKLEDIKNNPPQTHSDYGELKGFLLLCKKFFDQEIIDSDNFYIFNQCVLSEIFSDNDFCAWCKIKKEKLDFDKHIRNNPVFNGGNDNAQSDKINTEIQSLFDEFEECMKRYENS